MARITLTEAAIRHLLADPKLQEWLTKDSDTEMPILGYYRRSYLTTKDGKVIEYGDGFMFTFDHPHKEWADQGLSDEIVYLNDRVEILVLGPASVFSTDFIIDWTKGKYSFQPQH